jgi:hypothetical protein
MSRKNKFRIGWTVLQELPIEKFFKIMDGGDSKYFTTIEDIEYSANLVSTRLLCIKKNPKCVVCGIEATIARLECQSANLSQSNQYHFNVYAKVEDENYPLGYRYVTLTQDHIFPKSLGGPTTLDNLQTMCSTCNKDKDNSVDFSNLPLFSEETKNHLWQSLCKNNNITKTLIYFIISSEFNINREEVKSLGVVKFSTLTKPEELLKRVFIT